MQYQLIEKNEKHVDAIAARAQEIQGAVPRDRPGPRGRGDLLAPARDPEGARRARGQGRASRRVLRDHASNAIREAVAQPRELSLDLVNAQQARRALDYLVGFNLSPLLWKKVRRGLSAGRVQSPGAAHDLRARGGDRSVQGAGILDASTREGEHSAQTFPLKLIEYRGEKVEQFSFTNEARRRARSSDDRRRCRAAATLQRRSSIDRKQRRRNPSPPFTTSTLQQEAARKLGFNAQRTMRLAQQLYEGVDIGEGAVGLITYMRTDSVNLAAEAVQRDPRGDRASCTARKRGRRAARLQDQVEERAGSARGHPPDLRGDHCRRDVEGKLDADQFKLYALIWKRAVACRWRTRCSTRSRSTCSPAHGRPARAPAACCAPTAPRSSSPATSPCTRKDVDDGEAETTTTTCCRR